MKLPIIYIALFLLSCQTSVKNNYQNLTALNQNSDTVLIDPPISGEAVKQISNKGIEFSFVLGKETPYGENSLIEITYFVKNTNTYEVNYVNASCNRLDYYLRFDSESYRASPHIHCNATYPIIEKLAPGKTIESKLQILKMKDAGEFNRIGIDFRAVDTYVDFAVLKEHPEQIDGVYRAATKPENIIWTPVK